MQWMPPTQTEPNQMLMTTPTEMYAMPPPNGSFVPSHQPNQPYQGIFYWSFEEGVNLLIIQIRSKYRKIRKIFLLPFS